MSQKYENTRYFVFRVLDRVGSASSRQIIGMMIASGAGYYAPTTIAVGEYQVGISARKSRRRNDDPGDWLLLRNGWT